MVKNKKALIFIIVPLLLLIAGGGYFLWSRNRFDPERYETLMEDAQEAYEDLRYSDSLDLFLEASELAPRKAEPYLEIVKLLSDKNRFPDAENLVKGVIVHLEPSEYGGLWAELGKQYKNSGRYFESFESYEQAYKYSNDQIHLLDGLDAALRAGRRDKVDEYIPEIESESETLLLLLSEVDSLKDEDADLIDVVTAAKDYVDDGYSALAIDLLEAHKEKMENYWEGKFFLGRAYYDLDRYEEAIVYLDGAVALGADDPILYLYLARAYDHNAEKSSAYNHYDRAVSFAADEDRQGFVSEYIHILIEDEQFNRAEDILVTNEEHIWSQVMLMELYWAMKDMDKFETVFEDLADEEVPAAQELTYVRLLSEYYLYMDVDLVTAGEYIDMIESSSWSYLYQGMLTLEEGNVDEAQELFSSAIDSDTEGFVTEIAERNLANL